MRDTEHGRARENIVQAFDTDSARRCTTGRAPPSAHGCRPLSRDRRESGRPAAAGPGWAPEERR